MRFIRLLVTVTAALVTGACAGPGPAAQPRSQPAAGSVGAPAHARGGAYRLSELAMTTPERGYGLFTDDQGRPCRIGVASTSDGGARFTDPVTVTTWRCANTPPAAHVVFGSRRDGFIFGPRLYVTHDGGRTWAPGHLSGQVLAVAPLGRSAWLLQARCRRAKPSQPEHCPVRLLRSLDGGRTWVPAPSQPPASVPGYGGSVPLEPAVGRSFLVRTGPQSGYLAMLAATPYPVRPGNAARGRLWRTLDGGRSWSRLAAPCTGMSYAVSAPPTGRCSRSAPASRPRARKARPSSAR